MKYTLTSSLFGSEFVNYKRELREDIRQRFSEKVFNMNKSKKHLDFDLDTDVYFIPIVVDSVEEYMSTLLSDDSCINLSERKRNIGKEYAIEMNKTIQNLIDIVRNDLKIPTDKIIKFGLEDGTVVHDTSTKLETIYSCNYNKNDSILYLLLTTETTIYGYILSILSFIKSVILG
jgi:hypothetical protein